MSRHGTVLPVTDPAAIQTIAGALGMWSEGAYANRPYPRSAWLSDLEHWLRPFYPSASSRDLNVTARSLAPFPLKEKP